MSVEMRSFLQLVYSLAKQYVSWYESNIKQKSVTNSPLEESGVKVV